MIKLISLKSAVKHAYQDFNNGISSGEVVYRVTFSEHILDDLFFTIDYFKNSNQLLFGFEIGDKI